MPQLLIKIKDKIAKPLNNCVICDNSDYTVKFIFDEEWEKEPLRIARFIWNKQYVDVQFTGDTCEVPVISKTNNLAIGVYAGDLRTTTPAILTCYTSILSEDVIEHSVTPSEYEEIMKLLNAQATDIAALKAVDKRIWTNLDTINKTASAAKVKAEEGVAKADSALARNIFTDEEKAKLANITNPMIIKGRVDTVNDLPTEAEIGWFYFVGLESASSYEEYCYSENGWEYIGLSQEGVDLSDYYTKEQVNTTVNELKAIDNSLGKRIDNVDSKASAAKIKAEEGVAKADNALTKASSNTTNISTHETRLDSIDNTLSSHDTRITTAQQKANSVDEKVDSTNEVVGQLSTSLQSAYNKINAHANDIAINRTTLGTQCKNLLKNTAVTKTVNGVTFTVNSDGTITANGTATNRIIFLVGTAYISQTRNYTYTGTPSGGASSTYSMNYRNSNVYKTVETGNGITTQFEGGKTYEAVIDIRSGVTVSNLTFYPMLRYADITDSTYEPYKESVDERLIKNKSNIALNKSTLGYQRKNLLKLTLTTKTVSGITFTVNDDYSITLNGTSTAIIWQEIGAIGGNNFRKEKLIFTGNPAGTGSGAGLEAWYMNSTTGNKYVAIANGNILTESDYDPSGSISYEFHINKGKTYNNVTFYPMLRYADITDGTYEPYKESIDKRIIQNKSDIAVNKSTLGYQRKNLLNETGYLSSITSVTRGTKSISGNQITLTATATDCYTKPHTDSDGGYRIPVYPDTEYIFSWESDNRNQGVVYVFMNGSASSYKTANNSGSKRLKFTTNSDTTFITIRLGVLVSGESITYSNIMLRYADITDDTYEPYKESVDERLIKNKSDIAINRTTLGTQCKNLLKNTAVTTTKSGITFTVNDDKSITVNGTATATAQLVVGTITKDGNYILTGCPSGGSASTYMLSLAYLNVSGTTTYGDETGSGRSVVFDSEKYSRINVRIQINKGVTVSNKTFYPMLRDADVTDSNYEPYQPSFIDRCILKDTAGIALGVSTSSSITIDNLASYTALWINVAGAVAGINFMTNLIVPVAYLAKSTSNSVELAGGIPSSAYITSEGVLAVKHMNGTITAKVSGNTLDLTISDGTIGGIEVISLM